jgi:hypothetical protein
MEETDKPKKLLFGRDIEGPYNRIEFPTKRPVIRRGPTRTRDLTGDERGYRYEKKDRFAGKINSEEAIAEGADPESGQLFKSTMGNRVDPEPDRTRNNVRNPMGRPAGVYEQRRAAEAGNAAAYWSSVAKRGAASDISAKNGVGGFCTNCDAAIPDIEAAVPKENKPRYVPVYAGPGKPPRQQLVGRSTKTTFEEPSRDDTLCATCTPVASSLTSSGQQDIAEQFMVRRARG